MEAWTGMVATIEQTLKPLGLMDYPYGIPKRMLLGALLGMAVVSWLKPEAMFLPEGGLRVWTPLASAKQREQNTDTLLPWWSIPVLGAFFFGVLI